MKPPFYEGKNQKELDEFIKIIEWIFVLDAAIYHTELVWSLYSHQYLKGNPSQRWKNHIRKRNPNTLSWSELKNILLDLLAPLHLCQAKLVCC